MSADSLIAVVARVVGRPEWGQAMLVEAQQISDPSERRTFAHGCVRALIFSVPAGLLGVVAAGLLSVAVVVTAVVRYPGLFTGAKTWLALGIFVVVVSAYVVAAAGLTPRLIGTRSTTAAWVSGAVIAGSVIVLGLGGSAPAEAVPVALFLGLAVAFFLGWRATRRASSAETGVQCIGLAGLVAGFSVFLLWAGQAVLFAGRPYDAGMVRDFRSSAAADLATYAVSDSLGAAMVLLLLVPLATVAVGAVGAAAAERWSSPVRSTPTK